MIFKMNQVFKTVKTLNTLKKPLLNKYGSYVSFRTLIGTVKHHNKKEKPLSSTSIIVQDGVSILEMPCIVQVINGDFEITSNGKTENGNSFIGMGLQFHHVPKSLFKNIDFEEESEMALGFLRCNTLQELFNLLNTCPEDEITPSVALTVIKRIFELENNIEYRNQGYNQLSDESNFTFTRNAILKRLIETICASTEPQIIVDTLRAMGRDINKGDKWNYLEQICTENIILASDGKLNVKQVCEIIKAFDKLGEFGKDFVEKAWVGINDKNKEFDIEDICNILSILPIVKNSRMYLYNIIERKLPLVWHKMQSEHVIRIAYILVQLKLHSSRLLGLICRWTNLNIHTLTEGNLRWIVYACLKLGYTDINIQQALSRYMKAKNIHIKDYSLVSVILDYCSKLRVKHPTILSYGAEYYSHHGKTIPASQTCVIVNCFGNLSHVPDYPQEFFKVLEYQINCNFSQFSPHDLIDLFLSCIYIQRYPLNFVRKIFNPHFFERMNSLENKYLLSCKEKLMILDTVLTIEGSNYKGPILPRNYLSNTIIRDARVMRCINKIRPCLLEIVGNEKCLSVSVLLPSLPSISLFVIDCIIDTKGKLNLSKLQIERKKYAIFIHVPEHFDVTETHLLGPQALKKRVVEYFGFQVVGLNYQTLNKLSVYPDKLKEYILQELKL